MHIYAKFLAMELWRACEAFILRACAALRGAADVYMHIYAKFLATELWRACAAFRGAADSCMHIYAKFLGATCLCGF